MDGGTTPVDRSEPTHDEVFAVARGIASAVAPPGGVTEPQAGTDLLSVDHHQLAPGTRDAAREPSDR